jgi:hypothetical protein
MASKMQVGTRVQGQINVFVGATGYDGNGYRLQTATGTITKVLSVRRVAVRWDHEEYLCQGMAMNKKELQPI